VSDLDAWVRQVVDDLGLDADDMQTKRVLDLARDVAHNVVRPGAPVTAYLMGVAVGRGADPAEVADRLSRMAQAWGSGRPTDSRDG
jgi:hypothetical protein